jgi:hypothetical protein
MAAKLRRLLAVVLCGLLAAPAARTSAAKPWGIVLSASGAHIGGSAVSLGANVYDGDRLSTEAAGTLHVRGSSAQIYLAGSTTVVLNPPKAPGCAALLAGTAVFSTARDAAFELCAWGARIRAQGGAPAIGQVTVVGPNEVTVTSRRGTLVITVEEDTQVVTESVSYRVLLDSPENAAAPQGPRGAGTKDQKPPPSGRQGRFILVAIIAAVATVTTIAVLEALESPDRP